MKNLSYRLCNVVDSAKQPQKSERNPCNGFEICSQRKKALREKIY